MHLLPYFPLIDTCLCIQYPTTWHIYLASRWILQVVHGAEPKTQSSALCASVLNSENPAMVGRCWELGEWTFVVEVTVPPKNSMISILEEVTCLSKHIHWYLYIDSCWRYWYIFDLLYTGMPWVFDLFNPCFIVLHPLKLSRQRNLTPHQQQSGFLVLHRCRNDAAQVGLPHGGLGGLMLWRFHGDSTLTYSIF